MSQTKTTDIAIIGVESGDWYALFINGSVAYQGHSIPQHVILEKLFENQPFQYETKEVSDDWIEEQGGQFPNTTQQIPEDAFT